LKRGEGVEEGRVEEGEGVLRGGIPDASLGKYFSFCSGVPAIRIP